MSRDLGSVEPRKIADLVVLDADPLKDIRNTRRIHSVISRGRVISPQARQRMLADVIPLGGGVPIQVGEDTIGGVGLSGAPMGQALEEACATAGIAKVADQLR